MIWFIKHSLLSIGLIAALLWIGYQLLKKFKGAETAQRLLSSRITPFLVVIATIAVFCLVFGTYGFISAWLFLTLFSIIWHGSWPLRRLKAGRVLSRTHHRPKLLRSVSWINLLSSLFIWGYVGSLIWSAGWLASKTIPKGYLVSPNGIAFYLFLMTFTLQSLYLSIFEGPTFRANGICYQCKFIPWDRIDSYNSYSLSKGILTLSWQPTIPIYSRQECISITPEQVNLVKNILGERLEPETHIVQ